MALTRIDTDQITDGAVSNAKIAASAAIAGSKLEDDMTYGSNLTVSGNLVVNGTTTTVDTTNMSIEDPLLVFSANASGSGAVDSGFVVERGDDTNVGLIWDESADKFNFITTTETGSTAGNISVAGQANIIAGNIEGTITTAAQNTISSATSLASVGTITTGVWSATDVAVAAGGTGASTASDARTNLGLAIGSDVQAYDAQLADVAGLAVTDGGIIVGDGSNFVLETGATARASLGLTIGTHVQAYDAQLADVAGLAVTDGGIIVGDGSNFTLETGATARTSLGLAIGTDVQAYDVELAALAGLASAADKGIQFTGSGTAATYDLTAAGKALLDDANAAAQLVTLGLTATAAELNTLDDITSTTAELNIVDGDTAATATTLELFDRVVVNDDGTMVQVALTDFETYFESALDTLNNVTSASSLATVGTIGTGVWNGTAIADAYVDNDLTISGGTVNDSVIGGSTPAAGTFTTLTANDQLVVAAGATITGDTTDEITLAVKGVGSQTANLITVEISDGTDKFTIASDGSVVISEDLTLASGATVSSILDEDAMGSDSATALATQQSIKAYVDSQVGSATLTVAADSGSDDSVTVGTDTLTFTGGNNITTTVSDNDISVALDATVSGLTALSSGQLNADNIRIDGNVISSTDTNGNITLTPDGTGDVVISGDLTVNGTTTTVNSTVTTLDDPIMTLGGDTAPGSDDDKDRGIEFRWHNGSTAKVGFFGYDDSVSKFTFIPDATISGEVASGTVGNVIFGNVEGTITTAAQNSITSATSLASVGTIGTGTWEGTDVGVAHGGTGASTASDARTNLGVAIGSDVQAYDAELAAIAGLTSAADKGIQFTGSGTAAVYDLTSAGKALLDDADAAAQRTTLGLVIGTDVQAYDAELAAIAGLTSAADKGIQFTGSGTASTYDLTSAGKALLDDADAAAQRTTMGVAIGSDVQAYDAGLADIAGLAVTDGNIIVGDGSNWTAETGATARASLGLTIGTHVQAYDAQLADVAGLAVTDGGIIVGDGSNFVLETGSTARASLGLTIGTHVQAYDAELAAIAGLTSAADKGIQFTGSGTAAVYDLTAAGKALLDDANAAAQLVTLGVTPTAAELTAAADGDTAATSTTLADADRVVVNDGGTMVQVALTDFETYFETALDTLNNVTSASSLATVGTITSGTWEGTTVAVDQGGTGATSLTANSLLTGNGTSAVQAEANITYDGTTFGVDDAAVFNESGGDNDFRIESSGNANMFYLDAGNDAIGLLTATPNAGSVLDMSSSTESMVLPSGTTAQRPGSPAAGMFRYNSTNSNFEYYNGSSWKGATTEFTVVRSETKTGDGTTTDFTGLNSDLTTAGCIVTVNGVVQLPTTAYGISGTTITFTEAPANGDAIEIREITTTTSVNALEDADGDTKVQVEESSDEDIIRFDVGGTEIMTLTSSALLPSVDSNGTTGFDLGGSSDKWRDLYLSGDSIYFGDLVLKDSGSNTLQVFQSDGTTPAANEIKSITKSGTNGVGDVGQSDNKFATVYATTFNGISTSAQYADLAERYTSDVIYEPGTVVSFGGDAEVTMTSDSMDSRIAGVVSTNPGFLMNEGLEGTNVAVALTGRVPVKVTGTIRKGDMLVSAGEGYAKAEANPRLGSVIGKALEDFNGTSGIIEVVVGRL